jgi:hypothetical protein
MTNDTPRAQLRLSASRYGHYLTAGPEPMTLEFPYDSRQCGRAMNLLVTASEHPEAGVVPIALGAEVLFIDPSLHTDLGAELLVLQVVRDLGPLMDLYRPSSTRLN